MSILDNKIQLFDYVATQYKELCAAFNKPVKLNVVWKLNQSLVTCDTYKKGAFGVPLEMHKHATTQSFVWSSISQAKLDELETIKSEVKKRFAPDRFVDPSNYTGNLVCLFATFGDIVKAVRCTLGSTSNVLYNLKFINEPKKSLPFYCLTDTDTIQPVSLTLEN